MQDVKATELQPVSVVVATNNRMVWTARANEYKKEAEKLNKLIIQYEKELASLDKEDRFYGIYASRLENDIKSRVYYRDNLLAWSNECTKRARAFQRKADAIMRAKTLAQKAKHVEQPVKDAVNTAA